MYLFSIESFPFAGLTVIFGSFPKRYARVIDAGRSDVHRRVSRSVGVATRRSEHRAASLRAGAVPPRTRDESLRVNLFLAPPWKIEEQSRVRRAASHSTSRRMRRRRRRNDGRRDGNGALARTLRTLQAGKGEGRTAGNSNWRLIVCAVGSARLSR